MTELSHSHEQTPPPETIEMNTWFELFEGVEPAHNGISREIFLKINSEEVQPNSPLATQPLPIIVEARSVTADYELENILLLFEFPLDPDLGYKVDREDRTLDARKQKYEQINTQLYSDTSPTDLPPALFANISARIDVNSPHSNPFVQQGRFGSFEIVPDALAYFRRVRFLLYASGYQNSIREAADTGGLGAGWHNFHHPEGQLPSLNSFVPQQIQSGLPLACRPQHIHKWQGAFLSPRVNMLRLPDA